MRGQTASSAPSSVQDSYLASVSDLMVGLLFVFIIILMSFALRLREAETHAQQAEVQAEVASEVLSTVTEDLIEDVEVRNQLLKETAASLRQRGVQVHLDLRNGVLRLPEELLFDSGSAEFREEGRRAVEALAQTLASLLPCYPSPKVQEPLFGDCANVRRLRLDAVFVEGHTDNQPFPSPAGNWGLSHDRARTTYIALMSSALGLQELKNGQEQHLFGMSAYAETRPAASNESADGRRKNRRIDLRFILATPDEGELGKVRQRLRATGGTF